jgi:hypothetical protein
MKWWQATLRIGGGAAENKTAKKNSQLTKGAEIIS